MAEFQVPSDLSFNRGMIEDPESFARDAGAESWLYLCGPEFADVPGGMSYDQVEAAVPTSVNLVGDGPDFTPEMVDEMLAAVDQLPRPTLVTCRAGPRSSMIVYLHAGLQSGATADEVLARAEADGAPFAGMEPLRELLRQRLAGPS